MARRMKKAEAQLIGLLIIIGLPIYFINKLGESIGWGLLFGAVVAIALIFFFLKVAQKKQRQRELMEKYQDEEIVDLIMNSSFWQGQTSEQLLD